MQYVIKRTWNMRDRLDVIVCPKCGRDDALRLKEDLRIQCRACGYVAESKKFKSRDNYQQPYERFDVSVGSDLIIDMIQLS